MLGILQHYMMVNSQGLLGVSISLFLHILCSSGNSVVKLTSSLKFNIFLLVFLHRYNIFTEENPNDDMKAGVLYITRFTLYGYIFSVLIYSSICIYHCIQKYDVFGERCCHFPPRSLCYVGETLVLPWVMSVSVQLWGVSVNGIMIR